MTTPKFSLSDAGINADPYPLFARLRRERPVCRNTAGDGTVEWLVTRYADVDSLLNDKTRLSKDLRRIYRGKLGSFRRGDVILSDLVNRHLLFRDPPEHTRLRSLVNKAFTRRNVADMAPQIASISNRLLDRLDKSMETDLVQAYALPLPLSVIAGLLGISEEDAASLRACTAATIDQTNAEVTFKELTPQLQEFLRYLDNIFEGRAPVDPSGLISHLLEVRENSDRLSKEELFNMVILLVVAGFETVMNFIGNGTLNLLFHPEQKAKFLSEPASRDEAIDELLRHNGPTKSATRRWALEDFELGGELIRRGDCVRLLIASANRDESVFAAADELDLERKGPRSLTFGGGIHHCLGGMLARMQGRIALQTLFERYPELCLAVPQEQLRYRSSVLVRGLEALPVYLHPPK